MISLGHYATDFTGNIRQLGEFAQVCLPGVELPLFDVWLPKMIEDKGSMQALAYSPVVQCQYR